jgi:hypothetical protein
VLAGVLALCLLAAAHACHREEPERAPPPTDASGDLEAQQALHGGELVNSGRTLSGVYDLAGPINNLTSARYVFTEQGAYSRTRAFDAAPAAVTESGSYLIDADGRLVIYIEQSEGVRQTSASREIYTLSGDASATLILGDEAGGTEIYLRSGEAPPTGADRPSVE